MIIVGLLISTYSLYFHIYNFYIMDESIVNSFANDFEFSFSTEGKKKQGNS